MEISTVFKFAAIWCLGVSVYSAVIITYIFLSICILQFLVPFQTSTCLLRKVHNTMDRCRMSGQR